MHMTMPKLSANIHGSWTSISSGVEDDSDSDEDSHGLVPFSFNCNYPSMIVHSHVVIKFFPVALSAHCPTILPYCI